MQRMKERGRVKDNIIDFGVTNWRHSDNIYWDGEYCQWNSFIEAQQWWRGHMLYFEYAEFKMSVRHPSRIVKKQLDIEAGMQGGC